jgi:hypothetical protein
MCNGAREHKCWNGITFEGSSACQQLTSAINAQIEALPAFEPEFLAMVEEEIAQTDSRQMKELRDIEQTQQRNQREADNIIAALREHGTSSMLLNELARLERVATELAFRCRELQANPVTKIEIPSIQSVKQAARGEFARLAVESHEFAQFMRRLLPSILVFPVRLCDGGGIALRAFVTFTATPLVPREATTLSGLRERLTRQFFVDLFDPPQRERFREDVVRMRLEGRKEHEIADVLKITKTAVQRAAALQRKLDSLGIVDSWIPVREPPDDYGKLRRHLHRRYGFEPLDGFPRELPR